MHLKTARRFAIISILLTPFVLMALTAYRWRTGACAGHVDSSVFLFMLFAAALAASKNPYSAIAACVAYIPIGYIFSTDPCTSAQSQGAGGLIYLLIPFFILFILITAIIGAWVLRLIFGLKQESELSSPDSENMENPS